VQARRSWRVSPYSWRAVARHPSTQNGRIAPHPARASRRGGDVAEGCRRAGARETPRTSSKWSNLLKKRRGSPGELINNASTATIIIAYSRVINFQVPYFDYQSHFRVILIVNCIYLLLYSWQVYNRNYIKRKKRNYLRNKNWKIQLRKIYFWKEEKFIRNMENL